MSLGSSLNGKASGLDTFEDVGALEAPLDKLKHLSRTLTKESSSGDLLSLRWRIEVAEMETNAKLVVISDEIVSLTETFGTHSTRIEGETRTLKARQKDLGKRTNHRHETLIGLGEQVERLYQILNGL